MQRGGAGEVADYIWKDNLKRQCLCRERDQEALAGRFVYDRLSPHPLPSIEIMY